MPANIEPRLSPRRLLIALLCAAAAALMADAAAAQRAYATPETAADAFTDALKRNDHELMRTVLGGDWKNFIPTDDVDRQDIDKFIAAWEQSHRVDVTGERAVVAVGNQGWTLPVPLVKTATGWRFDTQAGAEEMRTRRIGRNELAAMQASLAYFDAQKDYARLDRTGDGVLQYAQRFASTPGKHDGLYWPTSGDEPLSPLGSLFTSPKTDEGYVGYRYKILKGQGKDAPGGAYSYLIGNRMVSGFALLATPLRYGDTGVMSFMISHDGRLFEKNLGTDTAAVAEAMALFNPDSSWRRVSPP